MRMFFALYFVGAVGLPLPVHAQECRPSALVGQNGLIA